MTNRADKLRGAIIAVFCVLAVGVPAAHADTWRGTAPFCAGECLAGETKIGVSDYGDGGYCVSGHKVLCRNNQPTCPVRQTRTHCAGLVMICDNGFYEAPNQVWHSCSSYACGACVGISSTSPSPGLPYGPDTCKQGFVWREAINGDHVCVPPDRRTQAARDNAAAAGRRAGGGAYGPDTCKAGFVWREAIHSDHVCVTPNERATVASENRLAIQRRAGN